MLEKAGVKKLKTPGYYGLALALGGAEVSAQDLAALYAMLGNGGKFRPLRWRKDEPQLPETAMLSPEAAFLTLDMLSYNAPVDRRRLPFAKRSGTPYKVYWKTGTSYGYKDAWAAGLFGDYVLVVWVGNFDGTPNPAFTGREAAAPLFFRLVRQIAAGRGIAGDSIRPDGLNLSQADICAATGDLADAYCPQTVKSYFIPGVTRIKLSGVSRRIPIEVASGLRACRHTPPSTRLETYDFWPTDVLQAFARAGINIRKPPAFARDCAQVASLLPGKAPDILFPADNSVFIRRHGQKENRTIPLQAAADSDASVIYWFVNQALAGQTRPGETLEIVPEPGRVEIQAVDDLGRSAVRNITVKLID